MKPAQHLAKYWASRSNREKVGISLAATVLSVGVAYGAIWEPGQMARQRLRTELPRMLARQAAMQEDAREIRALRGQPEKSLPTAGLAKEMLESKARESGLALTLQASGEGRFDVAVTAPVGATLTWLESIQREHGIGIVTARIEPTGSETVSLRARIETAGPRQ